jgi:predicted nucleotidyltransferase component of viral defense system
LSETDAELTFKGGTCLCKIHGDFYRLSEDLDFTISTPTTATRAARSASAAPLKRIIADIPNRLRGFQIAQALTVSNNSQQYNAEVVYASLVTGQRETIRIEIGLREPNLAEVHLGSCKTVVLSAINNQPLVELYEVQCLSYSEAMAEKMRAALSRREVAIRDFYDLDHAVRHANFNPRDAEILRLLRQKLEVPRTAVWTYQRGDSHSFNGSWRRNCVLCCASESLKSSSLNVRSILCLK